MRQDGLYKVGRIKWELIYGFGKDNEGDDTGWNWRQRFVGMKPSDDEIRDIIIAQIDSETDRKILSGFSWKGIPVWLSKENQMNFKAAYDLSIQTGGNLLPIKFKLGEDSDGNAMYHVFADMEEFSDFYTKAVKHITGCLEDGWEEKDRVKRQGIVRNG